VLAACVSFSLARLRPNAASQSAALEPGTRIRVQVVAGRRTATVVGDLISASPESIVYHRARTEAVAVLPRDSIISVERSIADGNHVIDGALLGLLGGVVAGGVAGYGIARSGCTASVPECLQGPWLVFGGATGGLIGLVVGAIVGKGIEREGWEPANLPRRIGLIPRVECGLVSRVSLHFYY
jgi:hypothetical protein